MVGEADLTNIITGFGDGLLRYSPQIKYSLIGLLIFLFAINIKYIIKGTEAWYYQTFFGYKKITVLGNDRVQRGIWVSYKEDYKLYSEKAYILDKSELIENEFGEKTSYYVQDFTEPLKFVPYKKYIWVDKKTGEPLRDKDGKYVSKLNIKQFLEFKYKKEINDEFKRVEDLIQPTLLDNVIQKQTTITDVMFPSKIAESKRGIDSSLTANVIVRRMKIDAIGWLQKYWKYVMFFGIILILGSIIVMALTYGNSQKIDLMQKNIESIASSMKSILPKPVGGQ